MEEDSAFSGSGIDKRSGFARLTSEVALAHVGIVLGLDVSRLARNNAAEFVPQNRAFPPTNGSVVL